MTVQLCSDSITARTLTNVFIQTADIGFHLGNIPNTGTLTLGGLDLNGETARTLDIHSDVVLSGALTNGVFTVKDGA